MNKTTNKKHIIVLFLLSIMWLASLPLEIYADNNKDNNKEYKDVNKVYEMRYDQVITFYYNDKTFYKKVKTEDEMGNALVEAMREYASNVIIQCEEYVNFQMFADRISNKEFYISGNDFNYLKVKTDNGYNFKFQIAWSTTVEEQEEIKSFIKQWVENNIKADMTDYQKIKTIHDYIVNNYRYYEFNDGTEAFNQRYSIYGAIKNKKAVCGAFSGLFRELCEESGVQVKDITGIVESTNHAWNMVNLNGNWYHVDVTFGLTQDYDYFLKTDDEYKSLENREWKDFHPKSIIKWNGVTINK